MAERRSHEARMTRRPSKVSGRQRTPQLDDGCPRIHHRLMEPPRRSRRPKGMRRVGCAVVMVVLIGCSSGHASRTGSTSSTGGGSLTSTASMTPKAAALALGRRLLDEVILPSGSRPLTTPEPAALGGFVPQPGVGNLLFAHRLFTVNETPYDLWH